MSRLNLAATGTFDVATGSILLAAGNYSLAGIRGALVSARGNGSWSGQGITSTSIRAGTPFAVGYRMLQNGSLVVGYAAVGDANMDGSVDGKDLTAVSTSGKYGSGVANAAWWQGDFNYDGVVNIRDIVSMRTSGLYGRGSYLLQSMTSLAMASTTGSVSFTLSVTGAAPRLAPRSPGVSR